MTTDKLADFWSDVLCVRDRKKCLNRKDMDTYEIDAAGDLFIIAVRKVVDSGHELLMAWDDDEEEKEREEEERDFQECMNDHSGTGMNSGKWVKANRKNKKSKESHECCS